MNQRRHFVWLLPLFFVLLACTLSLGEWAIPSLSFNGTSVPATPTQQVPTPTPLPQAEVTFIVQPPPNTPPGTPLRLALLDEVTGLALNPTRYNMEPLGNGLYRAVVPLSVGSVVKYRYERAVDDQHTVPEYRTDGLPVRYRLLRVDGPMEVRDLIAHWADTPYTGPTGRIVGRVTDATTGAPIPDVLVTAGGQATFTLADGSFLLEGLPPWEHNLVAYHIDQRYTIFQQLAQVAAGAATPAEIALQPRPLVPVQFSVIVPQDTVPNAPVYLAGNLYSLGNTFGDLAGGMSTLAPRLPVLQPTAPQRYTLTLQLPAGAYIRYKYTLGDGFWNAEHTADGAFALRELIVPPQGGTVEDQVVTWRFYDVAPTYFTVTVPDNTPIEDQVYIQFNPGVWTAPLPMWPLGENRWGYVFYGPIGTAQEIRYRYCRNPGCDATAEARAAGPQGGGRTLVSSLVPQNLRDTVTAWAWYNPPRTPPTVVTDQIEPRAEDFVAGIALTPAYSPTWPTRTPNAFRAIAALQARWVFLSPTWTATRTNPPVFEPLAGHDPLLTDLESMAAQAREVGLQVALWPDLRFPTTANAWWNAGEHTFAWWVSWWDRYQTYVLHFAEAGQRLGAQALVLGGPWVAPALPGGLLADGSPSGVPADAEARWRALIAAARQRFTGRIYFAWPANRADQAPPFLDAVDGVLLLWDPALSRDANASAPDLEQATAAALDELEPLVATWQKPALLAPAYPAADGGTTGCVTYRGRCLTLPELRPENAPTDLRVDLDEQVAAYNAFFRAVNRRPWVQGVVIREFYPLAALQDPSPSLYGKPAANVVWYWFNQWRK